MEKDRSAGVFIMLACLDWCVKSRIQVCKVFGVSISQSRNCLLDCDMSRERDPSFAR